MLGFDRSFSIRGDDSDLVDTDVIDGSLRFLLLFLGFTGKKSSYYGSG